VASVLDVLRERGFVQQCTDAAALEKLLSRETVTYYVGYDPTASSLHAGSLLPIMAMAHLQRAGHRPIAIVGGGTTMIGDPSGKTEMRPLMSREQIDANGEGILAQLQRYLQLDGTSGLYLNNADWLLSLGYIEFLRDIGRYFRVNDMLRMEAYRARLEREEGLSFIEFNYQLLQAYDFLVLARQHGCRVQMGGDDQWGNILAGVDLNRRLDGREVYGLTFPLLTTARGEKMGKTAGGAVWLDVERTSPYDFYQYWINTDDKDVERFLGYFTFLPMEEVKRLGALQGADLNAAKEILALEVTRLAHGEEEATAAQKAARAAFGHRGDDFTAMPTTEVAAERLEQGISIVDLLCESGLTPSRNRARGLISQGGAYVNGTAVTGPELVLTGADLQDGAILLRFGKKKFHRVVVSGPNS